MISFLFIACLSIFQNTWVDALEDLSFSQGDRIPGSGDRCVLAYDHATDDPSTMLLFGCNGEESVLKRYNVSSDQWIVMDGEMRFDNGSISNLQGPYLQSSTTLNETTFSTTYHFNQFLEKHLMDQFVRLSRHGGSLMRG